MSFRDTMNLMLPPINGVGPHETSPFGATDRPSGSTNPHVEVDFNYFGGQSGINLTHADIYSPVSGEVVSTGGRLGEIVIRGDDGYAQRVLHTQDQFVAPGDRVQAGDPIGTMGNTGTRQQH